MMNPLQIQDWVNSSEWSKFTSDITPQSRLRLAPTPSGFLHQGNALNFYLNWLAARQGSSHLLLRIDDLDADRKRPEFVQDVFDSLQWMGIHWDEGPRSADDFEANWSQHLRIGLYEVLLEKLRERELVYACKKSRRDLQPFNGVYPPEFREQGLSLDEPDVAWRVKTPDDFPMPDFIVRRRDGIPAYQIASLADDVHFGVTHIIRGADLESSTQAQIWLAEQLDMDAFLRVRFFHHGLLMDENGKKQSKSEGAASLKSMRDAGGLHPWRQ